MILFRSTRKAENYLFQSSFEVIFQSYSDVLYQKIVNIREVLMIKPKRE